MYVGQAMLKYKLPCNIASQLEKLQQVESKYNSVVG